MPKLALYVPLKAKPGKESDVAEFLTSALPLVQAEPGTLTWYAIQEGRGEYAIFDTFDTEDDRQAHLDGNPDTAHRAVSTAYNGIDAASAAALASPVFSERYHRQDQRVFGDDG